jgi:hypothetical protein
MSKPLNFSLPFENFFVNPMTNWERFFNPQFFISYNSQDNAVENAVLREAGSYGFQLARILDALQVLTARCPQDTLTADERQALARFQTLCGQVEGVVRQYRPKSASGMSLADVDRFVTGMRDLKEHDPQAYQEAQARVRKVLDGAKGHEKILIKS